MATTTIPVAEMPHQTITIDSPEGLVQFTMDDLAYYNTYALRICINYGTQIGASIVLLIVLILLTHAEKRRSLIFKLNTLSLVLNIIRVTLGCLYYTGPFYEPYVYFTADYSNVKASTKATSITTNVMTLLVLISVQASLIFQIRVVSVVNKSTERFWLTVLSVSVAMTAIGFRLALVVLVSKATLDVQNTVDLAWLNSAVNITMTISICFFCIVFLWKLGHAIMQRRKLGIQQFGPMQAIFIMGTQTLIIPALFSIFQYVGEAVSLQSLLLTSVALCLPLSAMWASAQVENRTTYAIPSYVGSSGKKSLLSSGTTDSTIVELQMEPARKYSRYPESYPDSLLESKEVV